MRFKLLAVFLGLSASVGAAAGLTKPPNVIWILMDDFGESCVHPFVRATATVAHTSCILALADKKLVVSRLAKSRQVTTTGACTTAETRTR